MESEVVVGGVEETIERMQLILVGSDDAKQAHRLIRNLLDSLNLATLRRIEAVMYSGRGDGSAVELRRVLTRNHPTKQDVIRAITEKQSNFSDYFERGIGRAKADGINLDSF